MKKFFLLIISTFLFVQLACLSVQAQKTKSTKASKPTVLTAEQIAKNYLPSIVLIVCDDGKGNTSLGSGFFVGQGMILTNNHVIKGMVRGKVKGKASFTGNPNNLLILEPKEWWVGIILQIDTKNDLALLTIEDLGSFKNPILSLSDSNKVNIGEKIYVLSNPQGLTGTISQGIVSSEIRKTGDLELLQIDAPISQGSSGGAVLNAQGKVVGIATASLSNGQNLNFAVPSSRIGAFLSQYNSGQYIYYPSTNFANAWAFKKFKMPVGLTEEVEILDKPRANYTDAARQNQVQGTVTLQVTFLANGKIGNISVVSGLPNGLTKQAIAAARNIRFSPQLKNGVAQTVIKQVQYNFTLY